MLLTNGRIYTLDARGTIADTLVVRAGRVAFAGRRADVNAAPGEEVVDLGGAARGRARRPSPARRVDQRAELGSEPVAGRALSIQSHARSRRAGASGRT